MNPRVTVKPDVLTLIAERDDLEDFVNSILLTYLTGGFFRRSEVAGVVNVKGYVERISVGEHYFDTVTGEFRGVTISGEKVGDTIFVPNQKLLDLVRANSVILVLKTPRSEGISVLNADKLFTPPHPDREH